MERTTAGPPAWIEWDAQRWWRNRSTGYYYGQGGTLLHVVLWERHNGPVPEGHEIHHRDHRRENNDAENLQLLTRADHRRLHEQLRAADPSDTWVRLTPEQARENARRIWDNREPRAVTCVECSTVFYSTGMRAKRCSDECRRVYGRRRTQGQRDGTRARAKG